MCVFDLASYYYFYGLLREKRILLMYDLVVKFAVLQNKTT